MLYTPLTGMIKNVTPKCLVTGWFMIFCSPLLNWLLRCFFLGMQLVNIDKYRTELIESMGKDDRMQITHGDLISEHAPKCRSNDSSVKSWLKSQGN